MAAFIFFAISLTFLGLARWLTRINRWPKVQARVLKKWEEITGRDIDNFATGWQHAEVEYWYESKKYTAHWRGDIQDQNIIQSAVWMVIDPKNLDQPQLPGDGHMAAICAVMAVVSFIAFLYRLINTNFV
jgi:hypothetical protein